MLPHVVGKARALITSPLIQIKLQIFNISWRPLNTHHNNLRRHSGSSIAIWLISNQGYGARINKNMKSGFKASGRRDWRRAGGGQKRYEGRECNQWMSFLVITIFKVARRAIFGSFEMTAFCFQFRSRSPALSLCKVTKQTCTQKKWQQINLYFRNHQGHTRNATKIDT